MEIYQAIFALIGFGYLAAIAIIRPDSKIWNFDPFGILFNAFDRLRGAK